MIPQRGASAARAAQLQPHRSRAIRVNLDSGVVVCHDRQRIYGAVDHVLDIVGGRTNCVMGTGALPLETPPENMRLIRDYLAD